MKLVELGTISSPQPTLLTVQVWDGSILQSVLKGIMEANLGLNPSNDGTLVRLPIPSLTAERREEFIKILHKKMEEAKVDVRKEDKTIREFRIPAQKDIVGEILTITSFTRPMWSSSAGQATKSADSPVDGMKNHKPVVQEADIHLKRRDHLLLRGPNGIGKSTLLETIAKGTLKGARIAEGVTVGYYRQDFSMLNFEDKVFDSLYSVTRSHSEQRVRSVAAGFLISSEVMQTRVGDLSEGQKGLVAFARLVLQEPGLLILDEPTNHINFRHIPIIAKALSSYEGAMVLVSHVPEFVARIRIDKILDLEK